MLSSEFEEQNLDQSFYVKTSTALPRNSFVVPTPDDLVGQVEECKDEFVTINNKLIRNPKIIGRLSRTAHPHGAKADSVVLIIAEV